MFRRYRQRYLAFRVEQPFFIEPELAVLNLHFARPNTIENGYFRAYQVAVGGQPRYCETVIYLLSINKTQFETQFDKQK